MPYWETYYHIIWATKHRQPTILPTFAQMIDAKIRDKSESLQCPIHAINMMSDHVHVAVSIRPAISVAEWVKQVKGLTAYDTKRIFELDEPFKWQSSYGVLTFGIKQLLFVVDYINNQQQHHANQNTYARLERDDDYHD